MWILWLLLVFSWNMWTQVYAVPQAGNDLLSDVNMVDEIVSDPGLLEYLRNIVLRNSNYPTHGDSNSRTTSIIKGLLNKNLPTTQSITDSDEQSPIVGGIQHRDSEETSNSKELLLDNNIFNQGSQVSTPKPELDKENEYICFEKVAKPSTDHVVSNITNIGFPLPTRTNQLVINQPLNPKQIQVNQFGLNNNFLHNLIKNSNSKEKNEQNVNFESKVKSSDMDMDPLVNSRTSTKQNVRRPNRNKDIKQMKNMLKKILNSFNDLKDQTVVNNVEGMARGKNHNKVNVGQSVTNTTFESTNVTLESSTLSSTTSSESPTSLSTIAADPHSSTTISSSTEIANTTTLPLLSIVDLSTPFLGRTSTETAPAAILATNSTKITPENTSSQWIPVHIITATNEILSNDNSTPEQVLTARHQPVNKEAPDRTSEETQFLHCIIGSKKPRLRSKRPIDVGQINLEHNVLETNNLKAPRKRRPLSNNNFQRNFNIQTDHIRPETFYFRRIVKKKQAEPQKQFSSSVRFAKFKPAEPCTSSEEDYDGENTIRIRPRIYDNVHRSPIYRDLYRQHTGTDSDESVGEDDLERARYREPYRHAQYYR